MKILMAMGYGLVLLAVNMLLGSIDMGRLPSLREIGIGFLLFFPLTFWTGWRAVKNSISV